MKSVVRQPSLSMAILSVLMVSHLVSISVARACPFCSALSLTLAEQIGGADVVLVARWVSAEGRNELARTGSTTLEVSEGLRGHSKWDPHQRITVNRYREGREGDLFLLLGSVDRKISWHDPLPITKVAIDYSRRVPGPEVAAPIRLRFFLEYLESSDKTVAEDAHSEFANADYKDVEQIKAHLSPEKLRRWLTDPKTESRRLGFYGMLLGLCGTADDARFMAEIIARGEGEELRLGIDGLMGGYLLLTGDAGVDFLERTKLKPSDCPFTETYSAVQALRFAWTYAEGRVSRERLKVALRTVLHREDMADLIVADLSRWKDWDSLPLLMRMYDSEQYKHTSVKRAIIRFANACSRDVPKDTSMLEPRHAAEGRKALEELRKKDPMLVADALRFLVKLSREEPAKTVEPEN